MGASPELPFPGHNGVKSPELDDWVVEYLVELKHDPELLRALWGRSDLPFPNPPPD